ncbi:hypothetical protein ASE74_08980 [Pedobacter sp. Leaf216]|nr:hypothetical protein ASE74_08980 [Pedobacter sp. Leaf216]
MKILKNVSGFFFNQNFFHLGAGRHYPDRIAIGFISGSILHKRSRNKLNMTISFKKNKIGINNKTCQNHYF